MEPESNSYQSTNQSMLKKPIVILILVLLGFVLVWLYLSFTGGLNNNQLLTEEELQAELERLVAEAEKQPFTFEEVPEAPSTITLPPPPESNAEDTAAYQNLKTLAEGHTDEDVANDTVYNFPVQDTIYEDFINSSEYQFTLYQMHDELRQLIVKFNNEYKREPLSKRITGVTQIGNIEEAIFEKPETAAVYPNVRSAEAFLVAGILSYLYPDQADMYQQLAQEHAERGITYGHYGLSDLEASRSLANQYLSAFLKNHPDLTSLDEEVVN